MIPLEIVMDGTGILKDVPADKFIETRSKVTLAALPRGTAKGKPTIAIIFELPDGTTVMAQTTMALFHAAAKAFAARFGWQDTDL